MIQKKSSPQINFESGIKIMRKGINQPQSPIQPPNLNRRPVCQFGEKCYRKNPEHIKEFHPERLQPAPLITEVEGKKICPYGEKCYRRNPEHIKEFHPERLQSEEITPIPIPTPIVIFTPTPIPTPIPTPTPTPVPVLMSSKNDEKSVQADKFLDRIIGMTENEFRLKFGFRDAKSLNRSLDEIFKSGGTTQEQWIQEYPIRAEIFEGEWTFPTIEQLRQWGAQNKTSLFQGSFKILFWDPSDPDSSEVQYLASQPENWGATFQVASVPFGPLEGASAEFNHGLSGIIRSPVQGEWCVITSPGPVFRRKYFNGYPLFLWENFLGGLGEGYHPPYRNSGYAIYTDNLNKKVDPYRNDIDSMVRKLNVGIQFDSPISHGKILERGSRSAEHILQVIDDPEAAATFVFTAAMNLPKFDFANPPVEPEVLQSFGKAVISSAYEGAAWGAQQASARKTGIPKLYLTMVGASAFRNPLDWLNYAMNTKEFLTAITGLEVILIYRPEKRKYDYGEVLRTPENDFKFLTGLPIKIPNQKEKALEEYLRLCYGEIGVNVKPEDISRISELSKILNH